MSFFRRELEACNPEPSNRRWHFVPYDQLSLEMGPLAREDPREMGIVLIENPWKARQRPYHQQKLALVLSNLRHFALEAARAGIAVRHLVADGRYAEGLGPVIDELGTLSMMEPAERELREDLRPLIASGAIEIVPHEGWLSSVDDFRKSASKRPGWRMDSFYRHLRRRTGILMEGDRFAGGRLSFDAENRKPWKGDPPAPERLRFPVDEIKREVATLVARDFFDHPGRVELEFLPATQNDAEAAWAWARENALPHFGPYEDAMSTRSATLFHTQISGLLNLHRLLPERVVRDAEALDIPLAGKEGFIRQILGWREFVRHVHRETDGLRRLPSSDTSDSDGADPEHPNFLDAREPLPDAYWGSPSGLHCLDTVVKSVWESGYGHHITRLMVLSNLATLLDIDPHQLSDWFWAAYTDAYDWVVQPNVLGMGTFATGELMTTKPYVSGAAYINRMSDYCQSCAFDPRKNCPITSLYWAFLRRQESRLGGNPRLSMPFRSLNKRSPAQIAHDEAVFELTRTTLARGDAMEPAMIASLGGV